MHQHLTFSNQQCHNNLNEKTQRQIKTKTLTALYKCLGLHATSYWHIGTTSLQPNLVE